MIEHDNRGRKKLLISKSQRNNVFPPSMIETLANELISPKCPVAIWDMVVENRVTDGTYKKSDLLEMVTDCLILMSDEELWKLYSRVLYHTRYKKPNKKHRRKAS